MGAAAIDGVEPKPPTTARYFFSATILFAILTASFASFLSS